ncbi:hypothetical protein NUW58_g4842 [Xylaria curta]|uniref:Uncharacterized protein n=1 Tax=Xylaria curta TaxID=42375 RepID=A0ACC1P5F6_9PEZI|nr:hypothetical protein NUW58_g4842 [Xylaria curta]
MSNPPVSPADDGYSEAIGNGHQTVNLVSAFVGLVGQPLSSAWARRQAHAALRKSLGEWAKEAFDTDNHCQQPVLREEPFVTHLIENRAAFHPSGSCKATFAWAKLLYSLDIRPGSNIIEWQPLATDADPNEPGTIELELEGPVLCHIVNLYQKYDCPNGVSLQGLYDRGVMWRFSFGAFSIYPRHHGAEDNCTAGLTSEPKSWTATFRPHSNKTLSETREPFVTVFQRHLEWSGGPLAFEANSVAINYVSTAKHSAYSDSLLGLPDPNDSLRARCLSLCECLAALDPPPPRFISLSKNSVSLLAAFAWQTVPCDAILDRAS